MLTNKILKFLQLLFFFIVFLFQLIAYSQNALVNHISYYELGWDSLYVTYNLVGDSSKLYDIKICLKDSLYPAFAFTPKEMKGSIGIGNFANHRNNIVFHKDQIPDDLLKSGKPYFEITASEVLSEIDFRDISKIAADCESLINKGVAVIMGIEDNFDKYNYIQNSAKLFNDYCVRILKIPFKKIRYELNVNATKETLESVFQNDGWLHNNISDGVSDVIIYFAGKCVVNEENHKIYLLPYEAISVKEGFPLDELIGRLEGFNPNSITLFIESFIQNGPHDQNAANFYFLPEVVKDKIDIMMACRGKQKNQNIEEEKMGLFTYTILKGLSGDSDLNGDKNISFRELYEYVKKNVWDFSMNKLRKEQDPILLPDFKMTDDRSDKIFIKYK